MGKLFGTDGIRGVVNAGLDADLAYKVGLAAATVLAKKKGGKPLVTIGKDTRISGDLLKGSLISGLCTAGADVLDLGTLPTPGVAWVTVDEEADAGIVISASHNPFEHNGIKVFTYGGRDADEVQTAEIERYINEVTDIPVDDLTYQEGLDQGLIEEIYPLNEYLDSIIDTIDMNKIKKCGLRVALDPMYGVSETSLKTILMTARCEVETIHERHDTLFGGKLPAPTAQTLRALQNYVIDRRCDLGIATDGDADRIGVIDDKGNFLHPNDILVLLYYYLVKYKKWHGAAVRNICTTHLLDRVAESFGESCYEVPVGFKHISAKMFATDAIIGGESSGGMAVRGHIKGKDGIYASALLVEMIAVTGMPLSQIMETIRKEYGGMALEERDYRFSPQRKIEIHKQLLEDKELPQIPYEIDRISYLDGLKIYLKDGGWISVRFSGTEPLLRIFCEMRNTRDAAAFCELFEEYLSLK